MKKIGILTLLFVLALSATSHGKILKYRDDTGKVWFVDRVESIPAQYRDQIKSYPTQSVRESPASDRASQRSRSDRRKAEVPAAKTERKVKKKVEIFVTSWCPYCKKLEKFLRSEGVRYKKYDIEKSKSGKEKYSKLGARGVPVIKVGDQIISGYAPEQILSAIGK